MSSEVRPIPPNDEIVAFLENDPRIDGEPVMLIEHNAPPLPKPAEGGPAALADRIVGSRGRPVADALVNRIEQAAE